MKTIRVRTPVTIAGIREGAPPMLDYHKIATRPDGKQRLFAQSVKITDTNLLDRLRSEVHSGDRIDICIEQCLGENISSILVDFAIVDAIAPALT